jgi:hypothetical protein
MLVSFLVLFGLWVAHFAVNNLFTPSMYFFCNLFIWIVAFILRAKMLTCLHYLGSLLNSTKDDGQDAKMRKTTSTNSELVEDSSTLQVVHSLLHP